jgi:hypothetical protein
MERKIQYGRGAIAQLHQLLPQPDAKKRNIALLKRQGGPACHGHYDSIFCSLHYLPLNPYSVKPALLVVS